MTSRPDALRMVFLWIWIVLDIIRDFGCCIFLNIRNIGTVSVAKRGVEAAPPWHNAKEER